jgi:molybdopterin/thiamine biosynthesis adenylyltransferase/rhodanese-related sulfurtransferase
MLESILTSDDFHRYAKQIKLEPVGVSGQEKLKQARVLCVGLGGLGSPLALYLAGAGVGTLGIIDGDQVALDNLHRQILYHQHHANQAEFKVTAAKEQLLALNPSIQINTYPERLTAENVANLIADYDIIADGSDNFYTRYLVHDYCYAQGKPYVYASASQFQGYCSIFDGKHGPCLRCLFPSSSPGNTPNCGDSGILGVLSGLLGLMQATEVIKWIINLGLPLTGRLLKIDLLQLSFKEIRLTQHPDCPVCVHHQPPEVTTPCTTTHPVIRPDQLLAFLQQHPEAVLVDVRTPEEHAEYSIGGQLIPLAELPHRLNELDPKRLTVLYCHLGIRSQAGLKLLQEAGFSSVYCSGLASA